MEYVYRLNSQNNVNSLSKGKSMPDDDLVTWEINTSMYDAISDICFINLYYPFNCRHFEGPIDDMKVVDGYCHEHSFEDVVPI